MPQPTATATLNPLLYQAYFDHGATGWQQATSDASKPWKVVNGQLADDGSSASIFAPVQAPSNEPYAVEASIEWLQSTGRGDGLFGLIGRGDSVAWPYQMSGFLLTVNINWLQPGPCCTTAGSQAASVGFIDAPVGWNGYYWSPNWLKQATYPDYGGWHTYRLEVRGNQYKVFVDGKLRAAPPIDNRFLGDQYVGIFSLDAQILVKSFRLFVLH